MTEGLTALRTLTGTPAFAAPEVLGFSQHAVSDDSYSNKVDIWALGVITFLLLTGETLFQDQRRLGQFVSGSFPFPLGTLLANKVSTMGCEFVYVAMAPTAQNRPGAEECLHHAWVVSYEEIATTQLERYDNRSLSFYEA